MENQRHQHCLFTGCTTHIRATSFLSLLLLLSIVTVVSFKMSQMSRRLYRNPMVTEQKKIQV